MQDSLDLLEWPSLFQHLLEACITPYGEADWLATPFLDDLPTIRQHQAEVEGLKTLLLRYGDVTSETGIPNITPAIQRLAKGGYLTLSDLRGLIRVLELGGRLIHHFARGLKSEPQLEYIAPLVDEAVIPEHLLTYLEQYIEPDGHIKDSASPKLMGLRQKLRHQKQSMQHRIQQFLQHPDYASALQSATMTERDGRTVFPIKAEYKNKMPGVLHGASATGATVYIEPQPLVDLNNALQTIQADLQEEIERIIRMISIFLQDHWEALQAFVEALARLDRRVAAARLSKYLGANPVELVASQSLIDLKQARHPLLLIQNKQSGNQKTVIANDIQLGTDGIRTMVVTGPNTGGKTVLLKTVGLFACMIKAGLQLPVGEGSRMAVFDHVLVDIGDQQSIAQSLSTFSAHIHRLKAFLDPSLDLKRGLVLIDEIAAGTDPTEGAALAKAVLDALFQKGALTIVTTHLGELKLDAHQHQGFVNASVEFDAETLSPTYRLMIGVPGASNAITIAEKLGLPEPVIHRARTNLSAPARESSELLQELETRNRQLQDELQRARSYRLEAQENYEKLAYERQKLEAEKRQTLKQFQTSLKGRIHELENQLKEMRKAVQQGNVKHVDRMAGKLRGMSKQADTAFMETRESIGDVVRLKIADLKVGDRVTSRQLELSGEVVAIASDSQEVTLQAGILRMTVPVSDLEKPLISQQKKPQAPQSKKLERSRKFNEGASVLEEPLDPSLSLDVRGYRGDEAMLHVEKFLDEAILEGYEAIAIIHGMGSGALKKQIRGYLSSSSYVKRYYPAQATQGGDGKTIIELQG